MDNIFYNGIHMDSIPSQVKFYEKVRSLDSNVHAYLHNIMTLEALNVDTYMSTKKELKHYFKKTAIKTINSMKDPKYFNNKYIINRVKKLTR